MGREYSTSEKSLNARQYLGVSVMTAVPDKCDQVGRLTEILSMGPGASA